MTDQQKRDAELLAKIDDEAKALASEVVRLDADTTTTQLDQAELIGAIAARESVQDAAGGWLMATCLLLGWQRGRVSQFHTVHEYVLSVIGRDYVQRLLQPDDAGGKPAISSFKTVYYAARVAADAIDNYGADPIPAVHDALELMSGLNQEQAASAAQDAIAARAKAKRNGEEPPVKMPLVPLVGRFPKNVATKHDEAIRRVSQLGNYTQTQALERILQIILDLKDEPLKTLLEAVD